MSVTSSFGKCSAMNRSCLGAAQPDPHDVWTTLADLIAELLFLLRRERAKGWLECADDLEFWETRRHRGAHGFGHAIAAAVIELSIASFRRKPGHFAHQVRSIDPRHVRFTVPAIHPHHGHSVRSVEKAAVQSAFQLHVRLRLHHAMHAGAANVTFAPVPKRIVNRRRGLLKIDGRNGDAEHVDARNDGWARWFDRIHGARLTWGKSVWKMRGNQQWPAWSAGLQSGAFSRCVTLPHSFLILIVILNRNLRR